MPVEGVGDVVGGLLGQGVAEGTLTVGMTFGLKDWGVLAVTGGATAAIGLGLGSLAHVPAEPLFDGSLLAGPSPVVAMLVGLAVIAVGLAIGRLTSWFVGVEAAVFTAAVGLWALAVRCGPVRPVLQYATGRGVWLAMAAEALILGAALVGAWWVLDRQARRARAAAAAAVLAVPNEVVDATASQKVWAAAVAVLVTGVVETILVQTDSAAQALAGVAVAGFAGALAGYSYLPLGQGAWYWTAPVLTAAIGYVAAFVTGDGVGTGDLHGYLAAIARPTPLHAASVGVAAAVVGHWTARRWALDEEAPMLADPDAAVP